jgi:hypothetical protein
MFHSRALKYMPHAVLKLLENMPMPWEQIGMKHETNVSKTEETGKSLNKTS